MIIKNIDIVALYFFSPFLSGQLEMCGVKPPQQATNASRNSGDLARSLGRIIDGEEAVIGAWPWMASVQFQDPWDGQFFHVCGAILITPNTVLTAAHCVDGR